MLNPGTAAPKQFWPELLAYTVPLMESSPQAVFSSADIFIFMQVMVTCVGRGRKCVYIVAVFSSADTFYLCASDGDVCR